MAKSAKRQTDKVITTTPSSTSKAPPGRAAQVTDSDIARRAYDLYLARGCEPGHDVDNWLQEERELRGAVSVAVA